jgi:hypothetical protein
VDFPEQAMHVKYGMALLILMSGPALAQSNCVSPIPPAAPDGRTASQADLVAAAKDARSFIAESDVYQQCMVDYVTAQKKKAQEDKATFDKSIETDATKRINDNQAIKVKVGTDINSAIAAFKASHPQ